MASTHETTDPRPDHRGAASACRHDLYRNPGRRAPPSQARGRSRGPRHGLVNIPGSSAVISRRARRSTSRECGKPVRLTWPRSTASPVGPRAWALPASGFFCITLPWEKDSQGFLHRIEQFLATADRHKIGVMFVLFDGVWDPFPHSGKQHSRTRVCTIRAGCRARVR